MVGLAVMPFVPPWNRRIVGLLPHGSSEVRRGPAGSGANLSGKDLVHDGVLPQSSGLPGRSATAVTTAPSRTGRAGRARSSRPTCPGWAASAGRRRRRPGRRGTGRGFQAFADDERFRRSSSPCCWRRSCRTRSPGVRASAVRSRALVSADVAFMVSSASGNIRTVLGYWTTVRSARRLYSVSGFRGLQSREIRVGLL